MYLFIKRMKEMYLYIKAIQKDILIKMHLHNIMKTMYKNVFTCQKKGKRIYQRSKEGIKFIHIYKKNVKMKNYLHMAWRQKKSEKKGKSLYVCMFLKYKTKFMYLNN